MQGYQTGLMENSGKMVVLMEIIQESVMMGEKILVFRLADSGFHICLACLNKNRGNFS
jgi:hypothetical protein